MTALRVPPATRTQVYVRDKHRCVRCGSSTPITLQHRTARGMGGSRLPAANASANLITLCGSGTTGCHGWVENHPTEALELGYRVRRGDDPTTVPVLYGIERSLYFLEDDGTKTWLQSTDREPVARG